MTEPAYTAGRYYLVSTVLVDDAGEPAMRALMQRPPDWPARPGVPDRLEVQTRDLIPLFEWRRRGAVVEAVVRERQGEPAYAWLRSAENLSDVGVVVHVIYTSGQPALPGAVVDGAAG